MGRARVRIARDKTCSSTYVEEHDDTCSEQLSQLQILLLGHEIMKRSKTFPIIIVDEAK